MTDKEDARQIYGALDRAVKNACALGMSHPDGGFRELRQEMEECARRAKRKANIAALERREKMRPFVEDFLSAHGYPGLAPMYKVLMKQPEFVSVLPKSVNPRQIKGDIEAILWVLDDEAELREKGLDELEAT